MSGFKVLELRQLTDQQVRFTPPARRRWQLQRAEQLLREVDPDKLYPYSFICFRITDYRSEAHPALRIRGDDLRDDLRLFITRVERSLPPLPAGQAIEPMLTMDEISKQFNVSTRTISRWRVQGLIGQRVIRNGRRQLGFPKSVVEQFAQAHPDTVARGSRFSHLTEEEKREILRRAQRLAQVGGSLTEVSRRIARRLERSVEAVRYTIKNHDRRFPEHALFPNRTGPLNSAAKQLIYDSYLKGITVDTLAKHYNRKRNTVYRAINEVRAQRLLEQPSDYIYHDSFDDPTMAETILAPMPEVERFERERRIKRIPKDVPPEFLSLYEMPLLSKEQEQHQFRKMNFLKHRLAKLKETIDPARVRAHELDQIEALVRQIAEVKDMLIQCNMRLVVSIAKQHAGQTDSIFELVSDGNVSLIRAVEKFDYSRGNKFSTYASWAIMKNFARSIPDEKHYRERYVTGHEDLFEAKADARTDEQECLSKAEQAKDRIHKLLQGLDARTRDVIRMRAGLDGTEEMTLEQIGQHFGITKERVRQINVRGMKLLRERAATEKIDLP